MPDRHVEGCNTERRGCVPGCDNFDPKYDWRDGDATIIADLYEKADERADKEPANALRIVIEAILEETLGHYHRECLCRLCVALRMQQVEPYLTPVERERVERS